MVVPYRIYMDDSGNVDPPTTNAPDVRYGSITAVILAEDYLQNTFNASFEALVKKHFGVDKDGKPPVLHRRMMMKPNAQGPFASLRDVKARAKWDADVMKMFSTAQYTVVTACVDKVEWYHQYPTWNGDFYEVLIEGVLERCWYFLKNRDGAAEVNVETKNPGADERIKRAYRDAMLKGFEYINATKLRQCFSSVEPNILKKADRRAGVQLADLIAGPSLQHIRAIKTGRHEVTSEFVSGLAQILDGGKYYREQSGKLDGYGMIWRPKART